jgi:hypothetical protein
MNKQSITNNKEMNPLAAANNKGNLPSVSPENYIREEIYPHTHATARGRNNKGACPLVKNR